MDNQHQKIKGYRNLSQSEIDLIKRIKKEGLRLQAMVEEVSNLVDPDRRWLSIANTDLQKGIMAIVRSVAKPTGF